jgi:hypothetical protein
VRVAIVDVGATTLRSVVAESSGRVVRHVRDRAVRLGLPRVLGGLHGDPSGTRDLVFETARRFRESHRQSGVDAAFLCVDPVLDGILEPQDRERLRCLLGADHLPTTPAATIAALARAAAASGSLATGPSLLLDVHGRAAVVGHLLGTRVEGAGRVPLPHVAGLAALARPGMGDGWLDVAVAATAPVLTEVGVLTPGTRIVATGPAVGSLTAHLVARRWRRPLEALDRVTLSAATVVAAAGDLAGEGLGRAAAPGPAGDPAEPAGVAVVLAGVMAGVGAGTVTTSDADPVEGRLRELLGVHSPTVLADALLDAAGHRATAHAVRVADHANALFDGLREVHALEHADREILRAAALLHDLTRDDGPAHHRRAADVLLGLRCRGVDPTSLVMVASVVRSQRGRPPGGHFAPFLRLPPSRREAVERLVAVLRLADGLDRGEDGAVTGLHVDVDPSLACVHVWGHDVDLALYGVRGQIRHAERTLGIRLVVRAAGPAAATVACS